jgi:hypothetical protein
MIRIKENITMTRLDYMQIKNRDITSTNTNEHYVIDDKNTKEHSDSEIIRLPNVFTKCGMLH